MDSVQCRGQCKQLSEAARNCQMRNMKDWTHKKLRFLCITLLTVLIFAHQFTIVETAPVNVALNKPITATKTCGASGWEGYYNHTQLLTNTGRVMSNCTAGQYPASAMVDGNPDTWWQSTNRTKLMAGMDVNIPTPQAQAEITVDLLQAFTVEQIILQMGDSKRPGSIVLKKSMDGINYVTWMIRVSNIDHCPQRFGYGAQAIVDSLGTVLCTQYQTDSEASNEIIEFDLVPTVVPLQFANWRNMRYLRLEYYDVHLTRGISGILFQHFTTSRLDILAECMCSGHETSCEQSNTTGQYACVCGGFTTGEFCESCLPKYNQIPFMFGRDCVECQCNSHSDACIYDANVALVNGSVDASGVRQGGGVCVSCTNNTAGNNCETCRSHYYRPVGRLQTSEIACIPCNCHGPGVLSSSPTTGLNGDCVVNNDNNLPEGKQPGECYCKDFVTGTKCDQCKPGYYNLQALNPTGCTNCGCVPAGTVGGSIECNVITGVCNCTLNVKPPRCDECKDEFYGLSSSNAAGCNQCNCDYGGSRSPICDKGPSGQCPCRRNLIGRECRAPNPGDEAQSLAGSYYPDLHFIHVELEDLKASWNRRIPGYFGFGYAELGVGVPVTAKLQIPTDSILSDSFNLIVRYKATAPANVVLTVSATVDQTQRYTLNLPVCNGESNNWCYYRVSQGGQTITSILRKGREYNIELASNNEVLLDRFVALPVEFLDYSVLDFQCKQDFETGTCDVLTNNIQIGTSNEIRCKACVFSLTTRWLDGALNCDCDPDGSSSRTCAPYGGQCTCKQGVTGRRCDQCGITSYHITSEGCIPCDCTGGRQVCDDVTGQCLCPPLVTGRTCDTCIDFNWNYDQEQGCTPCNCHPVGSVSPQCDGLTGKCSCKPGVTGDKCDQCMDGYKLFTSLGCSPCNCYSVGSTSTTCEKVAGQCPCKENVDGLTCDRCKPGSFYLDQSNKYGCLECVCMGITNQCTSSTLQLNTVSAPVFTGSPENYTELFKTATNTSTLFRAVEMVDLAGKTLIKVVDTIGNQPRLYWMPIESFRGDLTLMYRGVLKFTSRYESTLPGGVPLDTTVMIVGTNGDRVEFAVPKLAIDNTTEFSIVLSDENAIPNNGTDRFPRGEFLLILSNVQYILFPASWYDRQHTVWFGEVSYEMASPGGQGGRAYAIEQCQCGLHYEGLSCERCSAGYTRSAVQNHGYLGECVLCNCNNHATLCDSETGVCQDCRDNTAGDKCQSCTDGYYGDATRGLSIDCSLCPCYAPRVTVNTCRVVGSEIQCANCSDGYTGNLCNECLPFHYGKPEVRETGTCTPCECNGNSYQCDTETGDCIFCANNTAGRNCERCKDGFYGNATLKTCQPCNCNTTGSIHVTCDHATGQCDCHPGVGSRVCSECLPDHFGFFNASFIGCKGCECNQFGSSQTQCNEFGTCRCLSNAEGLMCDTCVSGYYGLPNQACQLCACDRTGALLSESCDTRSGQCVCKEGVEGRTCHTCKQFYVDFGPSGCKACGACQFSLGNDTVDVQNDWTVKWNTTLDVGAVQNTDPTLQTLSSEITTLVGRMGAGEGNLGTLEEALNNVTKLEISYNSTIDELQTQASSVDASCADMYLTSQDELDRQSAFNTKAVDAWNRVVSLEVSSREGIEKYLKSYDAQAKSLLAESTKQSVNLDISFGPEEAAALALVTAVNQTAARADQMVIDVDSQTAELAKVQQTSDGIQQELLTKETSIRDGNNLLFSTQNMMKEVENTLNFTKMLNTQTLETFNNASADINAAETSYNTADQDYNDAVRGITDIETMILGSNVAQQVSFPETFRDLITKYEIMNFNAANATLIGNIGSTNEMLNTHEAKVLDSELKAVNITGHANILNTIFTGAQSNGQMAVDAVTNYQTVAQKLAEAVQLSTNSATTLRNAQDRLDGVQASEKENEARLSKQYSEGNQTLISQVLNRAQILDANLEASNTTFRGLAAEWSVRDARYQALMTGAQEITDLAKEPRVGDDILATYLAADAADKSALDVVDKDRDLQPTIAAIDQEVTTLMSTVANTSNLEQTLTTELADFQHLTDNEYQRTLTNADNIRKATAVTMQTVDQQLATLEDEIERIRQMMLKLDQPVSFSATSYEEVDNPRMNLTNLLHNEIRLEFQYANQPEGVMFFVENPSSREVLALQLVNGRLQFLFNNRDENLAVTVQSPAVLCAACWYRIIANRYGIDGHLTVLKMETGGIAATYTESERGNTAPNRVTLTSKVYLGGLPNPYPTSKVNNETSFVGCLNKVEFDGISLSLWANILSHQSSATCCKKPPELPGPSLVGGANFNGLGSYLYYGTSHNLTVAGESQIEMQFRTFGADSVMLLVDKALHDTYYGIFMRNGRVTLQYGRPGGFSTVRSSTTKLYNDGEWYKLAVTHNATRAQVTVEYVNKTISAAVDVQTELVGVRDLTSLSVDSVLTIGGATQASRGHNPVDDMSFPGCIREVRYDTKNTPGLVLENIDLSTGVQLGEGVETRGCFDKVYGGVGFSESDSYVKLETAPTTVRKVEMVFSSYDDSGILMMGLRRFSSTLTSTSYYFYIALYNGDVFVQFNQGDGLSEPIRTRGKWHADGFVHRLVVDFGTTNQPILTVTTGNSTATHRANMGMSSTMILSGGPVYLGGIADSITLVPELPVTTSLTGGIHELKINDEPYDLYMYGILDVNDQKSSYLSGIPGSPDAPAEPLFTTTPAPPTTPPPTCAPPYAINYASEGVRFGTAPETYQVFNLQGLSGIFDGSFSIAIQFRPLMPDGLILYMADTVVAPPNYYLALYMKDWKLVASMQTNTGTSRAPASPTKGLTSKFDYDQTIWYEVNLLRINDFLALIIQVPDDYTNNQMSVSSSDPSTLAIETPLYLGGAPASVGSPFNDIQNINIQNTPFNGCIRKLAVTTGVSNIAQVFDIGNPSLTVGTMQCFDTIEMGCFMNSTNSYISLTNTYNIEPVFSMEMTLRTSARSGVLMSVFSGNNYFLLQLQDGRLQLLMSGGTALSFNEVMTVMDNYAICDNTFHSISFTYGRENVTFVFDSVKQEVPYQLGFAPTTFDGVRVSIGGIHQNNVGATLPVVAVRESLRGCIQSLTMGGQEVVLSEAADKVGVFSGCPGSA